MGFFATWVVGSIAMAATIFLVPGITAGRRRYGAHLALRWRSSTPPSSPSRMLSLPLTIVTLGIFYIVVNASMLELPAGSPATCSTRASPSRLAPRSWASCSS